MSLLTSPGVSQKLIHLLAFILLCVGYLNSSLISEPISLFLKASHFFGQYLVNKFLTFCSFIVEFFKILYLCFQILHEDFTVFLNDVTEILGNVVWSIKQCFLFLGNFLESCYFFVCNIFDVIFDGTESISQLGSFALGTVAATLQVLHLTGSTIWNFITSLPEKTIDILNSGYDFLINVKDDVFKTCLYIVQTTAEKIYYMYLLIFEIPLDSIYGLIVGGILLTVFCFKLKAICFMLCSAFIKLYKLVVSFGTSLWTGRFLECRNEVEIYGPDDDERLCVVCQFNVKEMITLPCKHLCLCWYCSDQIMKVQKTCPVCRTQIKESLKVYM